MDENLKKEGEGGRGREGEKEGESGTRLGRKEK